MTLLRVQDLSKRFDGRLALDHVSLEVRKGEFLCLVGPTNAGKSTLLKTIAGLHRPDSGAILIQERDIGSLPPSARGLGVVFQNDALFPDCTGRENIAFSLKAAGRPGEKIQQRVGEIAATLRIEHLLSRRPDTFSGGERKRVAIGRAIASHSDLLLLDEPLSGLDARLRLELRLEFRQLLRSLSQGLIYVTHDHAEAMSLADRIAVLHEGRIQQIGTPDEIYRQPVNRFVAGFFGSPPMNLLDAEVRQYADAVELVGDGFRVPFPNPATLRSALPGDLEIGIPPGEVRVGRQQSSDTPHPGKVAWIERLGSRQVLDIALGGSSIKAIVAPDYDILESDAAWVGFTPRIHHLVDRKTGLFLR